MPAWRAQWIFRIAAFLPPTVIFYLHPFSLNCFVLRDTDWAEKSAEREASLQWKMPDIDSAEIGHTANYNQRLTPSNGYISQSVPLCGLSSVKLVSSTDGRTKTLFAHGVRSPPARSPGSLVQLSARLSSFPSLQARRVTIRAAPSPA